MFTSFSTALSALSATSTAIDVVGNNLANLNPPGFKTSQVFFRDLVTQSLGAGRGGARGGRGARGRRGGGAGRRPAAGGAGGAGRGGGGGAAGARWWCRCLWLWVCVCLLFLFVFLVVSAA